MTGWRAVGAVPEFDPIDVGGAALTAAGVVIYYITEPFK